MKVTITTTVNLAEEFLVVPVHGSLKETASVVPSNNAGLLEEGSV